jgi:hypothetical protein
MKMNANKISEFLAANPIKVKSEKKTVTREKAELDKYGMRISGKGAKVNAVISDFAAAGFPNAVQPNVIYKFMADSGILADLKESKVKGHVSWFNRHYVFSPVKHDFIKIAPVTPVASAPRSEVKSTLSSLHLAR